MSGNRVQWILNNPTVKTKIGAQEMCPWASVIAKVEGGFIAFENIGQYVTWRMAH